MAYAKNPHLPIIYADIIKNDSYKIEIQGIKILNKAMKLEAALIDSGTSCITFPLHILQEIKHTFQNEYQIDCRLKVEKSSPDYQLLQCKGELRLLESLPPLDILIKENQKLSVHQKDYIYSKLYNFKWKECKKKEAGKAKCTYKLEGSDKHDYVILGDAFLQSFYTIFDQDSMFCF